MSVFSQIRHIAKLTVVIVFDKDVQNFQVIPANLPYLSCLKLQFKSKLSIQATLV